MKVSHSSAVVRDPGKSAFHGTESPTHWTARVAVALVGLLMAWLITGGTSDSYRLSLTRVGGLLDVAMGVGLAFLYGAIGWSLLGRRVQRVLPPLCLLATSVAVGVVAFGTVTLGLGWAGYYRPIPLAVLVAITALAASSDASGWFGVIHRSTIQIRRMADGPLGVTWLSSQMVAIGLLLVLALMPIADWDSLMYHVDLPIEFLEAGQVHVPVDNRHISYLSVVQFTYALPLAAGLSNAINVFTLIGFCLFLLVMSELGMTIANIRTARIVAVLIWVSTSWLLVASDARVEVWTACLLATTLATAFTVWKSPSEAVWPTIVLGVLGGAAVAAKLTSVPIVLSVLVLVLAFGRRPRRPAVVWALLVAGAVTAVPWFLKNAISLGDPLFPFLTGRGTDHWLRAMGASSVPGANILTSAREPFDPVSWILNPGDLTVEGSGPSQGLHPLVAFGWVPSLFVARHHKRVAMAMVVMAIVHVVFIIAIRDTTNLRYLQPALVPLTLASGIGLSCLSRTSRISRLLMAVVLGLSLVGSGAWLLREASGDRLAAVARMGEPNTWLASREIDHLVSLDRFLQQGDSVKTVLLFEARGAGFSSDVLQDNLNATWQSLTSLDLGRCPDLDGSTHMVVNGAYIDYLENRGVDLDLARWNEFQPYADACLTFLSEVGPYDVYRIETHGMAQ